MSAEIVSWKIPLKLYVFDGLDTPGVVRLEAPPEDSPFFKKGDELWDIGSVLSRLETKYSLPPEWAVWNATSARVVVKGSLSAIINIERMLNFEVLPGQCRVKIDLFHIPEDGAKPDFSKPPNTSLSLVVRSGQKASASISDDNTTIQFMCEAGLGDYNSLADLSIEVSASLPNSPTIEVNTATTLQDRSSVWIARDFDGETGLDLRLSLDIELTDGTPYHEAIQIQQNGTIQPYPKSNTQPHGRVAIGGNKSWLAWAALSRDSLASIVTIDEADKEDVDPFAETDPPHYGDLGLIEIQTPEALAKFMGPSVYDLIDVMKKLGLNLISEDFAGYDAFAQRIYFYSADEKEHDKFDQLFTSYCSGISPSQALTVLGGGEMRLICRSGYKATLKSTYPEPKKIRHLEIEPTIGETDSLMDLRVFYEEKSGEKIVRSLNSSATLEVGKLLTLMDKHSPGGAMQFKAEKLNRH